MRRVRYLIGTVVVLGALAALAFAQPPGGAPAEQGGAGGQGGFGGGPGMMGGPFMGMRGGPPGQTVAVATEKYLFVVRGNTVYQLDVDTLEILKQKELPEPERTGPGGPGAGGAGRQRPPMGNQAGDAKRQ